MERPCFGAVSTWRVLWEKPYYESNNVIRKIERDEEEYINPPTFIFSHFDSPPVVKERDCKNLKL